MAKYSTDFSGYTTGLTPSDWTERFSGAADWSWTIVNETGTEGEKILRGTATNSNRICLAWDVIDSDADRDDVEVLAKVRASTTTGRQNGINVRASETSYGYSYHVALDDGGTTLSIREYSGAGNIQLNTAAYSWSANTWYWIRFRVNGTNLYAKIWADGDAEPGSWTVTTTDATLSGVGYVGVGGYNAGSNVDFDYLAVATNGETASIVDSGIHPLGVASEEAVGSPLLTTDTAGEGVNNIVGPLVDGGNLTINGTGFGTKAQAAPVLWEDFESGVVGAEIGGNNGWLVYIPEWGGDVPVYANDRVYAGTRAFYKHVKGYDGTTGDFQTLWRNLPAGCDEVYVSMYIYWDTDDGGVPDAGTHKWLRLATGSDGYHGDPQWAAQAHPDGWWYDEARAADGLYDQTSHVEPKAHRGSWHRIETYYKLDASSGIAKSWVDLHPQQDYSGSTRNSGDATEVTTLMLPGAVANTNKGEDYWLDQIFVDNTRARVEIGNAATWGDCTKREPQPAASWSDSEIIVTLNEGGLSGLDDKWLYVVKSDGSLLSTSGFGLSGENVDPSSYYTTDFSEYSTGKI